MGKVNAYELFVRDVCRRRRDKGEDVVYPRLFKELDPEWRNMSDEAKQRYKDRAKNINSGRTSTGSQNDSITTTSTSSSATTVPHNPPPPRTVFSDTADFYESTPVSTTSTSNQTDQKETKIKIEVKTEPDAKPSLKRAPIDRDAEFEEIFKIKVHEVAGQLTTKKIYKNLPNARNIKKTNPPESVRYSDYYLFELKNTAETIVTTRANKLMTMPMYSYSCNVMCKYLEKNTDRVRFIPLEIAISAVSVKNGRICAPYHVLIDPGNIPVGCYNISKDHSELHKISIGPGNYPADARNDYQNIYKEMCKYTKAGERTLLISDKHDLAQVKGTIEWIYEKAVAENPALSGMKPSTWTILPIADFVTTMANHVHMKMLGNDSPMFVLPYYLRMQLECSLLDYNDALMCRYHSTDDRQTKWCAKSCAQRLLMVMEPTFSSIQRSYEMALNRKHTATQKQLQHQTHNNQIASNQETREIVYAPGFLPEPAPAPLAIEAPPPNSMDPRLRRREGTSMDANQNKM